MKCVKKRQTKQTAKVRNRNFRQMEIVHLIYCRWLVISNVSSNCACVRTSCQAIFGRFTHVVLWTAWTLHCRSFCKFILCFFLFSVVYPVIRRCALVYFFLFLFWSVLLMFSDCLSFWKLCYFVGCIFGFNYLFFIFYFLNSVSFSFVCLFPISFFIRWDALTWISFVL